MFTTHAFEVMQQRVAQRKAAAEKRREELYAKRPDWAVDLSGLAELHSDLEGCTKEIEAVTISYEDILRGLNERRSEINRAITQAENARRMLLETAPPFLANELRRLQSRLEYARSVVDGPEPDPPQELIGRGGAIHVANMPAGASYVPSDVVRAGYERLVNDHRQRVEKCRRTVAMLEPVVEQLTSLALQPDPSEEAVQKILYQLEAAGHTS